MKLSGHLNVGNGQTRKSHRVEGEREIERDKGKANSRAGLLF